MTSTARIVRVITYSSQDKLYGAENMMRDAAWQPYPWLCARNDKSGKMAGLFELQRPSIIDNIEIGNYGSSRVEIGVKLSSNKGSTYARFLAVNLLSLKDIEEKKFTQVYSFNEKYINKTLITQDWNRVKIICYNAYNKENQFGLYYIRFTRKLEVFVDFSNFSFNSSFSDMSEEDEEDETSFDNISLILKADNNIDVKCDEQKCLAEKEKKNSLKIPEIKLDKRNNFTKVAIKFFETCSKDTFETCEEYYNKFMEYRKETPTAKQKNIFRQVFLKMTGSEIQEEPFKSSRKTKYEDDLYSRMAKQSKCPLSRFDRCVKAYEKKRGRRLIMAEKEIFADKYVAQFVEADWINNFKKPASSKKRLTSPLNRQDFIQSDGQQPSTSRDICNDVCPICKGQFPSGTMVNHAATCGASKSRKTAARPKKTKLENPATCGAPKSRKKTAMPKKTKLGNPAVIRGKTSTSKKNV